MNATKKVPDMIFFKRLQEVVNDGEVDPRKAAEKVKPDLPESELEWLTDYGLRMYAAQVCRSALKTGFEDAKSGSGGGGTRFPNLRNMTQDPRSWPVCPSGKKDDHKPLGDCTDEDLELLANLYRSRAESMAARSRAFTRLREALVEYEVEYVRDLSDEALHGVLS